MADQFVQLPIDSTGKKIDTSEVTVGANTVERERVNLSDPTDVNGHSKVLSSAPVGTEYGLVVRPIGPMTVTPGTSQRSMTHAWAAQTATGVTVTFDVSALAPSKHSVSIIVAGTTTSYSIQLEGSLDNTNWFNISGSKVVGSSVNTFFGLTEVPVFFVRMNLTAVAGASPSLTTTYLGVY